ncbi:MAG: tetratricopeptide repeat protein [Nitrospinaceae bacterium]|nr:tetratricopeptide repeat protein [Nitrospinaceae bacterium]NIR55189.1 tetratricopeptide repeat protein [Nitrospinaceae bacterium]NIS85613.1 tetratricopeptide repeat protein [Nitrospinaceae bacterium]NIT82459.1 tetratricopeptide repeat protein [Nitrospinaceae bacterium]NIU44729.1 tetratricopeptide repeat protein [Nitrospinaceae bacterium]
MAALLLTAHPVQSHEVNKNAIVLLIIKGSQGQTISVGTGFIVQPEGVMITNYHVLVDAVSVEAVFLNGDRVPVKGVRSYDRSMDFSILQLEEGFYSTLEIGDSDPLKVYSYTSALGYPSQRLVRERGEMKGTLLQTYGFLLGRHPQALPGFSYFYTTTPFDPGFSGGPLVNQDNQVVGLATLEGRAINLALPINYIKPHLKETRLVTFRQLLEEDRNSREAFYYRGNFSLYALGEARRAIGLFERSLKIDPDFVPARYDLAVAYRGVGQAEKAIAEYEKALRINPNFPEALSNLGGQYFRQGDLQKAITQFEKAIQVYPNFIQALSNLGAALNKQGKYEQALPYLKRALALDPEFAVAHFNLGNAEYGMGNLDKAVKAFRSAVSMGVDFLSLHWKLYKIHLKKGQRRQAMAELQTILRIDPQNPEASRKLREMQTPRP